MSSAAEHVTGGLPSESRLPPSMEGETSQSSPQAIVSPLHALPIARLVSSRVDGTGEVHRVLFTAESIYELLRTVRDAQYGTIKAAVPLRALPDGTYARTSHSAVVKVFYKKLYRAMWGRLSKSHISEDARSELTTWAHLSTGDGHINVARLMDISQDKTHVFAVTEYARGGDLFDYLETRKFRVPVELMQCLAAQACDAVAYLHARRVAHRDVSLENMVLAQAGTGEAVVKVIDFGLARLLPTGPSDGVTTLLSTRRSGKVAYMAPEVYTGTGEYDPYAADVWALGVALFIMCTGCQPYDTPVTSRYKEEVERVKQQQQQQQHQQRQRTSHTPTRRRRTASSRSGAGASTTSSVSAVSSVPSSTHSSIGTVSTGSNSISEVIGIDEEGAERGGSESKHGEEARPPRRTLDGMPLLAPTLPERNADPELERPRAPSYASSTAGSAISAEHGASSVGSLDEEEEEEEENDEEEEGQDSNDSEQGTGRSRGRRVGGIEEEEDEEDRAGDESKQDSKLDDRRTRKPRVTVSTTTPPDTPATMFDLIASRRVADAMKVCGAADDLITAVAPLLQAMLYVDPAARPTAQQVLSYPWLLSAPRPSVGLASTAPCAAAVHELATRIHVCLATQSDTTTVYPSTHAAATAGGAPAAHAHEHAPHAAAAAAGPAPASTHDHAYSKGEEHKGSDALRSFVGAEASVRYQRDEVQYPPVA